MHENVITYSAMNLSQINTKSWIISYHNNYIDMYMYYFKAI